MGTDPRGISRDSDLVRAECYGKLRYCMEQNVREYYRAHPERLLDQRSIDKMQMMRKSLVCILQVLDDYQIGTKPNSSE